MDMILVLNIASASSVVFAVGAAMTADWKYNPLGRSAAYQRRRMGNWLAVGWAYVCMYMARYAVVVINTERVRHMLGVTRAGYGGVLLCGFWSYGVFQLINGHALDTAGGKTGLRLGIAGCAFWCGLAGLVLFGLRTVADVRAPASSPPVRRRRRPARGAPGPAGDDDLRARHLQRRQHGREHARVPERRQGELRLVRLRSKSDARPPKNEGLSRYSKVERGVFSGIFGIMISVGYYVALVVNGWIYASLPFYFVFFARGRRVGKKKTIVGSGRRRRSSVPQAGRAAHDRVRAHGPRRRRRARCGPPGGRARRQ